jgi:hypothetical protein
MKTVSIILLFIWLPGLQNIFAQNTGTPVEVKTPNIMLDLNYSNNYLFLNNNTVIKCENGDVRFKIKNDLELNFMGLFTRDEIYRHNKLYGGFGFNLSEYRIDRNLYKEPTGMGHFPLYYYYTPNRLEYNLSLFRFNVQLAHFGVYKRILVFQKLGLAYNAYNKTPSDATHYQECYGSSVPMRDPSYVTPDNPEGWYFDSNFTTEDKNDLDLFKNGLSAFYKFGIGCRIKQFTPILGFEFSYFTKQFASNYLKFQVGLNYAFLKK